MEIQARELLALGARHVLIKGGHGDRRRQRRSAGRAGRRRAPFGASASQTKNTHGTGCTLSSAIAAGLAKGLDLATAVPRGQSLCHRRHRRRRRAQGRPRPRPAASFPSVNGETHDHPRNFTSPPALPPACSPRPRSRARRRRNGGWSPPGRSACRGRACRPSASPSASARSPAAARHHRLRRRRDRAGLRGAGRGRQRRRRYRPHRLVLLAGQDAGGGVLHHRAVRPDADRARRLDRGRRRAGAVGRALRAVRRQAVHGRQYRRLHGRLVPPRGEVRSPICAG